MFELWIIIIYDFILKKYIHKKNSNMKNFLIVLFMLLGVYSYSQVDVDVSTNWKATPQATISGVFDVCQGQSANLTIVLTNGEPGWDVIYTDGINNYPISITTSPYTLMVTPTTTTVYTLVSVDNGSCTGPVSGAGVVTVNSLPVLSIINVEPTQCFGYANGQAQVDVLSGTAPYTYYWDNGVTTALNINLNASLHNVTVTDNHGCQASTSVTITQPNELIMHEAYVVNVNCAGGASGEAMVYCTGGTSPYDYVWSNGQTGPVADNLIQGTYMVTATDGSGCIDVISIIVEQDDPVVATITASINVDCFGSPGGSATVTATQGTAPYSYVWSNGQTTATATGLFAGNYSVTVTDANNCVDVTSVTITEPTEIVANLVVYNISCDGLILGSASVSATGGTPTYNYIWSNGQASSTVTNLTAGGYSVSVTDANGCIAPGSPFFFTIVQDPKPTADVYISSGTGTSCSGAPVELTATGGDSYVWSTGETTDIINVTPATSTWYYVTATNVYGCSDLDSVFVDVQDAPVITFTLPSDVCSDSGPITLSSLASVVPYNGGSIWFVGVGVASGVFYPSTVAVGGTYDITAYYTDPVTGCDDEVLRLITVHAPPTVTFNLTGGPMCTTDAPFVLTGGIPTGGEYSGPGVDTAAGTFDPALAGAGTHQLYYTYIDPFGCVAVSSDNVVVNAPTVVVLTIPLTEMCTGDSPINMNAYPSGGYYMVDGNSSTSSFDPAYWGPGVHEIVYSLPSSLCGGSDTKYITVYETPVVTVSGPATMDIEDLPVQLIVDPPGGLLTVNGNMNGVWFDPSFWGVGLHNIVYEFDNGYCIGADSIEIVVTGPDAIWDVNIADLISIYPNPATTLLNVDVEGIELSEIQMMNTLGQVVYQNIIVNQNHLEISVGELTNGVYFIRFIDVDGGVSSPFKFIKQ